MKRLIAALLIVGVVSPAWGGKFETMDTLLEKCQTPKNSKNYEMLYSLCAGYISGIADAGDGPKEGIDTFFFCIPDGVSRKQMMDVAVSKLSQFPPALRHLAATNIVASAFSSAWPCR
jgi:hypothetical protein